MCADRRANVSNNIIFSIHVERISLIWINTVNIIFYPPIIKYTLNYAAFRSLFARDLAGFYRMWHKNRGLSSDEKRFLGGPRSGGPVNGGKFWQG